MRVSLFPQESWGTKEEERGKQEEEYKKQNKQQTKRTNTHGLELGGTDLVVVDIFFTQREERGEGYQTYKLQAKTLLRNRLWKRCGSCNSYFPRS